MILVAAAKGLILSRDDAGTRGRRRVPYHGLSRGGVGRDGFTSHLPKGASPHCLLYVRVDDLDATASRGATRCDDHHEARRHPRHRTVHRDTRFPSAPCSRS